MIPHVSGWRAISRRSRLDERNQKGETGAGWAVKGIAPSTKLRKGFAHDPKKWTSFGDATELEKKPGPASEFHLFSSFFLASFFTSLAGGLDFSTPSFSAV